MSCYDTQPSLSLSLSLYNSYILTLAHKVSQSVESNSGLMTILLTSKITNVQGGPRGAVICPESCAIFLKSALRVTEKLDKSLQKLQSVINQTPIVSCILTAAFEA